MSQLRASIKAYQTAQKSMAPLQAVVMLYDGVLVRIARAAEANRNKDFERQFNEIMAAVKIVDGLNLCLDMDAGGPVAQSLRDLYESVSTGLMRSTGRRYGAAYLEKLGEAVRTTRDAWATIAKAEAAPSQNLPPEPIKRAV